MNALAQSLAERLGQRVSLRFWQDVRSRVTWTFTVETKGKLHGLPNDGDMGQVVLSLPPPQPIVWGPDDIIDMMDIETDAAKAVLIVETFGPAQKTATGSFKPGKHVVVWEGKPEGFNSDDVATITVKLIEAKRKLYGQRMN